MLKILAIIVGSVILSAANSFAGNILKVEQSYTPEDLSYTFEAINDNLDIHSRLINTKLLLPVLAKGLSSISNDVNNPASVQYRQILIDELNAFNTDNINPAELNNKDSELFANLLNQLSGLEELYVPLVLIP